MYRFAVCDDEEEDIEIIKKYVYAYAVSEDKEVKCDFFDNPTELINNYERGKYDIVILDVEMGVSDGIKVADEIRRIPDHDVAIIFVSNYPQYMHSSLGVRACDYLSKPLKYYAFEKTINKAIEYMLDEKDELLMFGDDKETHIVRLKNLISIETETSIKNNSSRIRIVTKSGQIIVKGKISDYENYDTEKIVKINRWMLVNITAVCKFNKNEVTLIDGRNITVSRKYYDELKAMFTKNIRREFKI